MGGVARLFGWGAGCWGGEMVGGAYPTFVGWRVVWWGEEGDVVGVFNSRADAWGSVFDGFFGALYEVCLFYCLAEVCEFFFYLF